MKDKEIVTYFDEFAKFPPYVTLMKRVYEETIIYGYSEVFVDELENIIDMFANLKVIEEAQEKIKDVAPDFPQEDKDALIKSVVEEFKNDR